MANSNGIGNGNGSARMFIDVVRWLVPMILAAVVAYYTAHAAIQTKVAVIEEREANHWMIVQSTLNELKVAVDRANRALEAHAERTAQLYEQGPPDLTPTITPPPVSRVEAWQRNRDKQLRDRLLALERWRMEQMGKARMPDDAR